MVPLYYTKEVILLPTASENDVVRGGKRKQILMESGFILSEICINKNWSEKQVLDCFEEKFQAKLDAVQSGSSGNK